MKKLLNKYNEDASWVNSLLNSEDVEIHLKIDGLSLQVYWNDEKNKFEYRRHSDELKVGPIITRLNKYFCKTISDAITKVKSQESKLMNYKFINLLVNGKNIYLLSAIKKSDANVIKDIEALTEIANEFDFVMTPLLYKGELNEVQQQNIISLCVNNTISSTEFKSLVKTIADADNTITDFDKLKSIPGIIVKVIVDGEWHSFEIVDNMYEQIIQNKMAKRKLLKDTYKTISEELILAILEWLEKKGEHVEGHMKSLEHNFKNMLNDRKMYNHLMNINAKLPAIIDDVYGLQVELIDPEIQAMIKKYGNNFKSLYENYLLAFYTYKEDEYINAEITKRMNKIITNIL